MFFSLKSFAITRVSLVPFIVFIFLISLTVPEIGEVIASSLILYKIEPIETVVFFFTANLEFGNIGI